MEPVQTQQNLTQSCCGAAVTAVEPLPLRALPHRPSSPCPAITHLCRYHHPRSSSPVSPSYPPWEKGLWPAWSCAPPSFPLSCQYLVEILFCSLLTNSAGLAKAHKYVSYLIGLTNYTLGNQQIKQTRDEEPGKMRRRAHRGKYTACFSTPPEPHLRDLK